MRKLLLISTCAFALSGCAQLKELGIDICEVAPILCDGLTEPMTDDSATGRYLPDPERSSPERDHDDDDHDSGDDDHDSGDDDKGHGNDDDGHDDDNPGNSGSKPGHGHGDKNHDHSGPPGQDKKGVGGEY